MVWSIARSAGHLLRDDRFRIRARVLASIEPGHVAGPIPRLALDIGKWDNPGAGAMVALRAKWSLVH
jgi:hypothetical protein